MSRLPRRPSRRRKPESCRVASTLSLIFFTFLAIILLCPNVSLSKAEDNMEPEYGTVIGIDIGTTTSSVAVYQNGSANIITNDRGLRTMSSWISFTENEPLVGDDAKNAYYTDPQNTVFDVTRLMGRELHDLEIIRDQQRWPFTINDKGGKTVITIQHSCKNRDFLPEEIGAMLLGKMKENAEAFLGHEVTHAVITVPVYYNDAQRQAGTIAGLHVLRVINEPTAAAIAYGLDKRPGESHIVVYDLGGGTLDVSLLSIDDGVIEVLATAGDARLGGESFDNRVVDYFSDSYKARTGVDVASDLRAVGELKREVEKAKRTLSSQLSTRLEIKSFEGGNDFSETLTRAQFEELTMDLFKKTLMSVDQVLEDAGVTKEKVNEIILVGGSSYIPKVRDLITEYFGGKEPLGGINPDEAVVTGAALQGAILSGDGLNEELCVHNICPLTLGIKTTGGTMSKLIPRNSVLPTRKSRIFSTAADNQSAVVVQVFEGERPLARDNKFLGELVLGGIPPAPRGVPQIEVALEVDVDGVIKVIASDKATGRSESMTIVVEHNRLSDEDIERMVREAEEFAAEEEAQRVLINADGGMINDEDNTAPWITWDDVVPEGLVETLGELEEKLMEAQDAVNSPMSDTIPHFSPHEEL